MQTSGRGRVASARQRCFAIDDWITAPEWITLREAAELSGYIPEYLRRVIRHNKIRAEKRGGRDLWILYCTPKTGDTGN